MDEVERIRKIDFNKEYVNDTKHIGENMLKNHDGLKIKEPQPIVMKKKY